MTKKDPQLFITALRVLARSIYAEAIAPEDIDILRRHALPEEADLPLDEFCCRLVNRALGDTGSRLPAASRN
jgi:hypothetical protein